MKPHPNEHVDRTSSPPNGHGLLREGMPHVPCVFHSAPARADCWNVCRLSLEVAVSPAEAQSLQQRWDDFETARKHHQPARVEFSAQEINQLISANHDLRGKAFVSVENNAFHFVLSVPLRKLGFRGRHLNGEIAVQLPPDGDPRGLEIKKIALNGVDVSERVLDFISGGHSLRSYIDRYSSDDDVTKVQISGDKVILESRGSGQ